ncbi:Leucine aminopeptidase 1 [Tulasnella sp. 418]|nr:Leucine aminopeptidase 1 [Tulasnella sp. 418]
MRNFLLATAIAAPAVLGLVVPNGQEILNPPKAVHADILDVPEGFSVDLSAKRLVQFAPGEPAVWMTELDKITAKAAGKKFFDITDVQDLEESVREMSFKHFPPISSQDKVKEVIKTLSTDGPRAHLEKFTSFRTRYYRSETGRQSQEWLLATIQSVTAKSAAPSIKDSITISEFPHSWGQNSIIVRINGSEPSEGTVIISAHQDSTNMWPFLPAPGADDDGSGTVTILESYRALIAAGFTPKETVEFHWYSAEEGKISC